MLDIYFDELQLEDEINKLNLLRTVNVIRNERTEYEKAMEVTIAETILQINRLKNEALSELELAKSKTQNEIVKIAEKNAETLLELLHVKNLNKALRDLNFYSPGGGAQTKNATQRILSYCYLSALINNDNVKIIPVDSYGVLNAAKSPTVGLISFSS